MSVVSVNEPVQVPSIALHNQQKVQASEGASLKALPYERKEG